jgi:hypothetical protein
VRCDLHSGASAGYRLYMREFENGVIYMNWTGTAQNISLPRYRRYMDALGKPTTHSSIPDLTMTYVTVVGEWSNETRSSPP